MDASLYDAVQPKLTPAGDPVAQTEDARAREQFTLFKRAFDAGHSAWMKLSEKYDNFYIGKQWEEALRAELEAEGRPALTINMVLSTVNVVLGEQITSRLDIQYKPRINVSEETAFAVTKLASAIMAANQYRWVESMVFADGIIQDRGYFDVRMDWSKSAEGEVKITDLDPANVILPIDAKNSDPATWPEIWYSRWMSLDDIEVEYGEDQAVRLSTLAESAETYGTESVRTATSSFGDTAFGRTSSWATPSSKRTVKSVRIVERQFRKSVRIYYLVDPQTGERKALPIETKKTEAVKLAERFNALLQPVTEQRIRWRVTADRFVLHDDWSPYKSFTIIPFFPYFRRGKPFGMVANLVSPQEQFNKLESQELHIVNTTANSGWIVEQGALHGMTSDDLAKQGSKTGLVVTANPGKLGAIQKIKANSIPAGIDRISAKAQSNIQYISGVNSSMLGTEAAEVSGVAMEKKTSVGQVQLTVVKDSIERTQYWVARKLLELIKDFMGYEQVVKYTDQVPESPDQQTQEVEVNKVQPDGSVKNDLTLGEYDISVTTMPSRDTFNDIQFAEALSLRNVGVNIPDYRVIQFSNLEQKHSIAEEVKQLAGLGDVAPEQQAMQARVQEAQVQDAEAEVAKKQALAKQAEAQAQLNAAKAQTTLMAPELQQRSLEQKHAEGRLGFDVRERLASLSAVNKLDTIALKQHLSPKPEGTPR